MSPILLKGDIMLIVEGIIGFFAILVGAAIFGAIHGLLIRWGILPR
jgi:hypothetical protein